jgi:hypothetical protein
MPPFPTHAPTPARRLAVRAVHPLRVAVACTTLAGTLACGDGASSGPVDNPYGITASGPGVLTVSPLDTSTHVWSTPLGALAPPGHVLPTDHVYLYFVDPWSGQQQNNDCSRKPVRAAGSGVISFVLQTEAGGDTKVDVQMTRTFHYYYDHVLLKPGVGVGTHVNAGDTIATTTGRCPSMDLGVFDLDVTPAGFVNPARYGFQTGHAVSPYRYFAEPLRSWLYARVRMYEGVPANKDGRIDYGVRGHLVGDWFHSSMPVTASGNMGSAEWARTIAFAYDWFDGTQPRVSIGGTIAEPGLLRIATGDPDPATVTPAQGIVVYTVTPVLGRIGAGWLVVQMLDDARVRVEYVAGATAGVSGGAKPTGFTSAAQEYTR